MKALAKDRKHRYPTAEALAADVTRYLNHEPVLARSPSRFYRLGKLVRRNKVVFATGAVVLLSLVLGLGASTLMFLRATRARDAAERARANEAALRQRAEFGEKVAHAAVLLKYQKSGKRMNCWRAFHRLRPCLLWRAPRRFVRWATGTPARALEGSG